MKQLLSFVFCALSLFTSCASCNKHSITAVAENNNNVDPTVNTMKITIGVRSFTATLNNNATTAAFKAMLPITIDMIELNGNEKYAELPYALVVNATNPGTIQAGDLMLYGSSTLVLFYKTFSTSYTYTRLGRVKDVTGLTDAVGSGNVAVTFEME